MPPWITLSRPRTREAGTGADRRVHRRSTQPMARIAAAAKPTYQGQATYQSQTYMGLIETRLAASQKRLGEGDTPTAGYSVVNVGVGYTFARNRLVNNISLRCDNVFNRVYRDNLSVIKDFLPQPARGFRLDYQATY